jgi:hypothetical protein
MDFNFRNELGKITPKIAAGAKVYVFGAGANWESICKQYRILVGLDLNACVDGFIDGLDGFIDAAAKQGRSVRGKPLLALSDIDVKRDVVLISTGNGVQVRKIAWRLTGAGMILHHNLFFPDTFLTLLMRWEYLRLLRFKGKHRGERCFIVGNGPSLTASDLDRLKGEISFATNRIYLMFDRTDWRPAYYAVADAAVLEQSWRQIADAIQCPLFYAYNPVFEIEDFAMSDAYFYALDFWSRWEPDPYRAQPFSKEAFVLHWGGSITYDCIQLAAYMGFGEIYLLGVDNNYSLAVKNDGTLIRNDTADHFAREYSAGLFAHIVRDDVVTAAYQAARAYAEAHGIKLRNATRGGNLEVFERVDFDAVAPGEGRRRR